MVEAPAEYGWTVATRSRATEILVSLRRLPGVEGVALARGDGIMVAQILGPHVDQRRVASLSAGLAGTADMAAVEIGRKEVSHTIVATVEGDVVLRKVGDDHILTLILRPEANLGLVLLHLGRVSEELRVLLEGVGP